jgi:hypothetical protein
MYAKWYGLKKYRALITGFNYHGYTFTRGVYTKYLHTLWIVHFPGFGYLPGVHFPERCSPQEHGRVWFSKRIQHTTCVVSCINSTYHLQYLKIKIVKPRVLPCTALLINGFNSCRVFLCCVNCNRLILRERYACINGFVRMLRGYTLHSIWTLPLWQVTHYIMGNMHKTIFK